MIDKLAITLGIQTFTDQQLQEQHAVVKEILKEAYNKPLLFGPMKPEIKKAISETLTGHITSEETKLKISKTVSKRNKEKVCGFGLGHSSKAGSIGGKSKSINKLKSLELNRKKSADIVKGSVWMNNAEKRARVPKNMIEQKLSQGWKLGFNK